MAVLSSRVQAQAQAQRSYPVRSYAAVLLTLAAAVIHLTVAPEHLEEFVPYGVFFIILGLAQVALAVALVAAPSRKLYAAAVGGTLAVIGLWLLSRTAGLPIAPRPWRPEPVGLVDFLATLSEAISVLVLLRRILAPRRSKPRARLRIALTSTPAALVPLLAVYVGVGSALNPMPVAFSAAPPVAGQASTSVPDLVTPPGNQPLKEFTLTAALKDVGGHQAWAYNGGVPGPELRVMQGDRVRVTLLNHLPDATSIHWHGINVPNSMDGVAGITQDAVPPGRSFVYEFIAQDAGTFWYHSHQDTQDQIERGLYGSIVVLPRVASVTQKRDYGLLVHSEPGTGSLAVNGTSNLHVVADPGDSVRLRIINGAVPGIDLAPLTPVLVGAPYVVAALDGHDLHGPSQLGPERIQLGMGQRADLVFTMPDSGSVQLVGMQSLSLPWSPPSTATVTIGDGPAPAPVKVSSLPAFDLTGYGTPAPDAVADASAFDVNQDIVLGAQPGFRNGDFDFMDTFNGHASPYVPAIHVREGQLVRLHVVNPGAHSAHPIHIHGHVFTVLGKNGRALAGSPVHLDSVLVGPGESWYVAFKAVNPGVWMLHCHILFHAASGMSMTLNYEGITTPYTMGSRSGNVPE